MLFNLPPQKTATTPVFTIFPIESSGDNDGGFASGIIGGGNQEGTIGTNGSDVIFASVSTLPRVIYGNGGNDTINGTHLSETIFGGSGAVDRTDGSDSIYGNVGDDLIYGNAGNDTIWGHNPSIFVDTGLDTIYGGIGSDLIYGNGDNDWLAGGGSTVDPLDAADTIYGGRGDDFILGNGGDDVLIGGNGDEDPADLIGDGDDTIYGGVGNDNIFGGGGGADQLFGQDGNDTISGGDVVNGTTATIDGGIGDDVLYGEEESNLNDRDPEYYVWDENENGVVDPDEVEEREKLEDISGLADVIIGGDGADTISGGKGNDTINSGNGNDLLYGNTGRDTFVFDTGFGIDLIYDFNPEYDTVRIASGINGLTISSAQDVLTRFREVDGGGVIDLSNGDNIQLIVFDTLIYSDSTGDIPVLRRMSVTADNIEIV